MLLIIYVVCSPFQLEKLQILVANLYGGVAIGLFFRLIVAYIEKHQYVAAFFVPLTLIIATLLIYNALKNRFSLTPIALDSEENPAASTSEPEANPVELEPAIEAFQSEDIDTALTLAMPFTTSTDKQLFADANRLCALSYSAKSQWAESFVYWLSLFEHAEPTAHNALNLASTSVMCGEIERGKAWFMKLEQLIEEGEDYPYYQALVNFISALQQSKHDAEALPYLEILRTTYTQLHITDSTFLHIRNVPFFSTFVENSWHTVLSVLGQNDAVDWFTSMKDHIDEDGKLFVDSFIARQIE